MFFKVESQKRFCVKHSSNIHHDLALNWGRGGPAASLLERVRLLQHLGGARAEELAAEPLPVEAQELRQAVDQRRAAVVPGAEEDHLLKKLNQIVALSLQAWLLKLEKTLNLKSLFLP